MVAGGSLDRRVRGLIKAVVAKEAADFSWRIPLGTKTTVQ
jgi:hypothetical protein